MSSVDVAERSVEGAYPWRVGIDIGGTFTDLVAEHRDGSRRFSKVLTTPGEEIVGILAALSAVDLEAGIGQLVHGTTLVINSLIQRVGARTALVTTRGFRDVVELGRGSRPEAYNLFFVRDAPLVPRNLRFEVSERMAADGAVSARPSPAELDQLAAELENLAVEAVAVGFINSYVNPENELFVAAELLERLPEITVTTSSSLSQQWREYERFETACANAFVGPAISRYVDRLMGSVGESVANRGVLFLDARGGGLLPETARQFPLRLVESGPVGGVVGALELSTKHDVSNLVTLDIGGTTAKAALIEDGRVGVLDEFWVGGYDRGFPVQVPVVDIVEVGAGGGSLAWISEDGRLQVGPRSAGAKPGPACYGRGGTEPTVTDAHAVCGRLAPEFFLSVIDIRPDLAHRAMASLAERADTSVDRLALGILELANLTMGAAVSKQTVERGRDPRQFTLIACGGAGSLHACEIADGIGIRRVLIPESPGHFSAAGMLESRISFSIRGILGCGLEHLTQSYLRKKLEPLRSALAIDSGVDVEQLSQFDFFCRFSMRFEGQEHTLDVPGVAVRSIEAPGWDTRTLRQDFVRAYRERFGYGEYDSAIEVVAVELEMSLKDQVAARLEGSEHGDTRTRPESFKRFTTPCLVSAERGRVDVLAVPRDDLHADEQIVGPAIVYEVGSVAFIPPGWVARRLGEDLLVTPTKAVPNE